MAVSRSTLPATVVTARTVSSGEAKARASASASSTPGSVSMTTGVAPSPGLDIRPLPWDGRGAAHAEPDRLTWVRGVSWSGRARFAGASTVETGLSECQRERGSPDQPTAMDGPRRTPCPGGNEKRAIPPGAPFRPKRTDGPLVDRSDRVSTKMEPGKSGRQDSRVLPLGGRSCVA